MFDLIVNGNNLKGKRAAKLQAVKDIFAAAGKELIVHFTERVGHAKDIARQITQANKQANIIAMGGDGTLHEVLNGLEDTSCCTLGIIPLGSGNDFAATAGIPTDTQKAAQLIAGSQPKYVDYIQMDSGLRTMNAVGAGMDVDVLERAYSGKHHGKSKYAKALIKSIFAYKSRYFSVSYDGGERVRYNGLIACLGNGKQIGGGIKLFPDADICDGYMNLIIVDYLSLPKTISAFIKLGLGKINSVKDATCVKCKQAEIIPEDEEFTIQSDGELYKNVPMNARLISNTLKFYLP